MPIAKKPTAVQRKATRKQRAPGRPTATSPELRPRLLDAAVTCYLRSGIAATTLRAIAREAGVTPALLHYYFGDAQQLQRAVVEERILPVFDSLRSLISDEDGAVGIVTTYVSGVGALVTKHPWVPALWVREVLCEGGALRELVLTRIAVRIPQMLVAKFTQAQGVGALNPDLDPRLLVVSLVGLALFPYASEPIWRRLFRADDIDSDSLRKHTIALLERGLGVG